jgi:dihydropteroate synthase
MGILNVTPDSFSDGGLHFESKSAIRAGLQMIADGADLVDVGGESTRPNAEPVSIEEEIRRTIPVVEGLAAAGVWVSIDTMKPEVAAAALDAGAFLINDVSGFRNPTMMQIALERRASVCIMHMQGEPQTMQRNPTYENVVEEVATYLSSVAARFSDLPRQTVWIDPGIGFGKTVEHNLILLNRLDRIVSLGHPVLVGISRKSFIGKVLDRGNPLAVEDRIEGSIAGQVFAQMRGARIIRAHDVRAASLAIRMTAAIQSAP